MSKLLFVFERDMPTISITRDVFSHLKGHAEIKSTFKYLLDIRPSDIDNNDVIIFMRPNNPYSWKIAKAARKAGHTTVTFCDDDLLNLPSDHPSMPWRRKGLLKMLAHSDVIWSSSRYITDKYKQLTAGKRMAITDTILQPEELEGITVADNDKVKIVYAAAPGHKALFDRYVGPIVPQLKEEFDISFTFVSVHPEVEGIDAEYVPGMPLLEFRQYMKTGGFDIGLAPLNNDEFSKCKYFNKFIEYTTQGIVGVYSKTEPYTYVVKDGENGYLAGDNPEEWLNALRAAISDKESRKRCIENAVRYLQNEHSEDACIGRFEKDLPEVCEAKGNYDKCKSFEFGRLCYYLMKPLDWVYLTCFYLRKTGFKAVINRTRTHFVESKAYRRKKR